MVFKKILYNTYMFYDTSDSKCVEIVLSIQAIHLSVQHLMEYFFLVCVS